MESHKQYEEIKKRKCDFIVEYRFLSIEEGGRKSGNPVQGYRSDFMYPDYENDKRLWMIFPEFLDLDDKVISDKSKRALTFGKAQMWILNDEFRDFHKARIKIGLKAHFVEGNIKVAECKVVEIVGLAE